MASTRLGTGDGDLGAWLAGLRVDDAVRARSRTRWMRRQAAEEGTFHGVLTDLGERGEQVTLHLHNGRRHSGAVVLVGHDVVGVRLASRRVVLVRSEAVASVRTRGDTQPTSGDRPAAGAVGLRDAVAAVAELGLRLLIVGHQDGAAVSGVARSVGRDVVTVEVDGGGVAYVALTSVDEVSVAESG